jgi:hypothetical protein
MLFDKTLTTKYLQLKFHNNYDGLKFKFNNQLGNGKFTIFHLRHINFCPPDGI